MKAAFGGEALHGSFFQEHIVSVFQVGEKLGRGAEKSAIDPALFRLGFFVESQNLPRGVAGRFSKAAGRVNDGHGQHAFRLEMLRYAGVDVHVADPIAVGEQEMFVVADVAFNLMDAPGGESVLSGFCEGDLPAGFFTIVVEDDRSRAPDGEFGVRGFPLELAKIVPDDVPLVAKTEDKFLESLVCVNLHDVPENRPTTDGQHRFRTEFGFFAEARALAPAEDDNFHGFLMSDRGPSRDHAWQNGHVKRIGAEEFVFGRITNHATLRF